MNDALQWLSRIPAFAPVPRSALVRAVADATVRYCAAGEQLVRAGLAQTHVLIVAQGALHLYRKNRDAQTQLLVAVVRAPATFGDAELYGRGPWMVSARAVEDTVVVAVPNAAYDALIETDVRLAASLYRECCARLLLAVEVTQVHGLQKIRHKILRLLWEQAQLRDGTRVARLSQVALTDALGVTRKTVARNLAELEGEGLIRRGDGEVALLLDEADLPWRPLVSARTADWRLPNHG